MQTITNIQKIILAITICFLFIAAIHPAADYDTYFGIKVGEQTVTLGHVPNKEVFSWSANGREWVAFEWLAQTTVYLLEKIGGFFAIKLYVAAMFSGFFVLLFFLLKNLLKNSFFISLTLSIFLSASIFEYFVARPQIIGFVGMVAILFVIYLFLFKNKNLLFFSLPMTYFWVNSHGSFIFSLYFFAAYAICGFLYFRQKKEIMQSKKVFKYLSIFFILNILVTLLPPLFFSPYKTLIRFASDLSFLKEFISEWGYLTNDVPHFVFYTTLFTIVHSVCIITSIKNKIIHKWLLVLPLLAISIASFQGLRYIPLGVTTTIITLGFFIVPIFTKKRTYLKLVLGFLLFAVSVFFIINKRAVFEEEYRLVPFKAVEFLKTHNLYGNMYNQLAIGGYLVYALHPEYKVFYDGRTEVYLYYEMSDFYKVLQAKHQSRTEFTQVLDSFFNKYNFSYAIIPISSYNPLEQKVDERMVSVLLEKKNWRLIYVDDVTIIFVKNDGKNKNSIKNFAMDIATPFQTKPFKTNKQKQAVEEYQRMIRISDSAVSRSALAQAYFELNQPENAQLHYQRALELNPHFGSSYLGLAKIALLQKDVSNANSYLLKAIETAPYLGEGYILLATLYKENGKLNEAKNVLESALNHNIDLLTRQKIIQLLNSL